MGEFDAEKEEGRKEDHKHPFKLCPGYKWNVITHNGVSFYYQLASQKQKQKKNGKSAGLKKFRKVHKIRAIDLHCKIKLLYSILSNQTKDWLKKNINDYFSVTGLV